MSDPNQEEIRRKRLARLAGSEPPASPPEPPKEVVPSEVVEEPAPMEEDETLKSAVTRSHSSSQMDLSNEADIKGSPEGTKSNEDSGVETMEVDDKADSEANTPVVERKEAEKRKRSSSSTNYELTEEQVMSTLQKFLQLNFQLHQKKLQMKTWTCPKLQICSN